MNAAPLQKSDSFAARYYFMRRFLRLAGAYWLGEGRWMAGSLSAVLFLLTVAQVILAIWTNYWNGALFDALGERSISDFVLQIGIFAIIFVLTMVVTAAHLRVKRALQLGWRRWLTRRLIDDWMAERRHYQLIFTPGDHDNPDGRISEDIHIVTEQAIALVHTLVYSILILGSFVDILLSVTGPVDVRYDGTSLHVPGYMVPLAFVYAGVGIVLGIILGKPLVSSTNALQAAEADFRFGLARARENSESVALIGGETMERRRAIDLFAGIREWWNRQTLALGWILFFTSGYGALLPVFPILVAAPQYIAGTMTLGVLMQTAQAFQKLTSALSWPVDNLADMARWRASAERILSLHDDIETLRNAPPADGHHIAIAKSARRDLTIRQLRIATPEGQLVLDGFDAEIHPGERVLIGGDASAAVDLFKVVAGLWPWGQGEVLLPRDDRIFFMPQRPFIPFGTLRAALAYPSASDAFDSDAMRRALDCAGLGYLAPRLDDTDTWDRTLTVRGQQRLGFARLFLQRPRWIFMQEATDAFDPRGEIRMLELLRAEFPDATVITIGFHGALDRYHDRKLTLQRAPDGHYLFGGPRPGVASLPDQDTD